MLLSMQRINIVAMAGLALILGACSDAPPPVNKAAIEKSVRDVESNIEKTMAAKDPAAFAANYATDAVFMSPGTPAAHGRDAIRGAMSSLFADPNLKLEFSSDRVEVAGSGDMAATRGSYTLTVTDPATKKPITDKGSYVTVFRKQADGYWKAVLDINTSEVPPPTPQAAKGVKKTRRKKR